MMIFLSEECNFACGHCVREDEPMYPGYKLTFEQLRLCLLDCRKLKSIKWVHFSGGEPTLWVDENIDLVDLFIEISKAGFEPGFTTNGSYFDDYEKCDEFFQKYFNNANKRLRLYISIDTFHKNFNPENGRAKSLDNVIKYKKNISSEKRKLLNIIVLTTISKDTKSLLPNDMIEYYESLGVTFNFVPLKPKGKAKSFSHLCPNLNSDEKDELGAYYIFHQKKKKMDVTSNIVLIGDEYYFPEHWRKVGQLGHLPDNIIDSYKIE
jgi:MoaA/NifB/PqqE/SkfB family radical SAM enzyme